MLLRERFASPRVATERHKVFLEDHVLLKEMLRYIAWDLGDYDLVEYFTQLFPNLSVIERGSCTLAD